MKNLLACLLLLYSFAIHAQTPFTFTLQHKSETLSLRGLCVVSPQIVWASGTQGTVLRTLNAGKTWQKIAPQGYEKLDFRDIHAFDSLRAIVINAGSPAYVLCTQDGGKTWTKVYENTHKSAFLDDLAFADNQNGLVFGDTDSTGKFLTLLTTDAGKTWKTNQNFFPTPQGGEAGFAASGSILHYRKNKIWLATGGGKTSHVFYSTNAGKSWEIQQTPICAGKEAQGIFSLAIGRGNNWVGVGGDYTQADSHLKTCVYTADAGKSWRESAQPPRGYRSGVGYVAGKVFVCVGTSGSDFSADNGNTWQALNNHNLNAIRFVQGGKIGWAVGNNGQIFVVND